MNFERGRSPHVAIGLGNLGRRGLSIDGPYIKSQCLQYHIREITLVLSSWYQETKQFISIFEFPVRKNIMTDFMVQYVITAAPGELTDYDSIYRKTTYDEIYSRFFRLINGEQKEEFCYWLLENYQQIFYFLKLHHEL